MTRRSCLSALVLLTLPLSARADGPATQPGAPAWQGIQTNRWVVLNEQSPTCVSENEVVWDSAVRRILWDGGHTARAYPQSSYTYLYDPVQDRFTESHPPARIQRRCQAHLAYLELERRMIVTDAGSGHGTVPTGGVGGDYQRVFHTDPRGPWLYDSVTDSWEDCRTLPPLWPRAKHTPIAYEPNSDAVFGLRGSALVIYMPRLNKVTTRPMPEDLQQGRLSHGLAADPVRRKLVLFGGGGGFDWVKPKGDQTVAEARRDAYERMAKNDTWVYDIVTDRWHKCDSKDKPSRGRPMDQMLRGQLRWHDPSGTMLLCQNGVDSYVPDRRNWGPVELWSFDVAAEQWTRVPLATDGHRPASVGLTAYARELDLLLMFGGHVGEVAETPGSDPRLTAGRQVWACRVAVPGRKNEPVAPPLRLAAVSSADGITLEWPAAAGETFEVFRAVADPLPGAYERIGGGTVVGGRFTDRTAERGKVYAYAIACPGSERRSLPAFNQPWRPAGLIASVESKTEVRLRWQVNGERDIAGYRVYRAKGEEVEKGAGQLLNAAVLAKPLFTDTTVDLSDGVIRSYWVTAVNRAGIESGVSPLAYTAPDAPGGPSLPEGVGPASDAGERINYVISWTWPRDVRVAGFNIYGASAVPDTSNPETRKKTWKKLNDAPLAGREYIYEDPKAADAGPPCRYFYVRAVNVLGQEGFCTDIVSPTDRQFRP